MSQHQAFRRVAAPAQMAQKQETVTFPAPIRGLIISENESYMQPGAAVVCDNWKPTMKSVALRGGCELWCDLHPSVTTLATWNPADLLNVTLSLADLKASATGAGGVRATISKTTGKCYYEISYITIGSNPSIGLALASANLTGSPGTGIVSVIRFTGNITVNGSASGSSIGLIGGGAVVGIAVDLTAKLIWFRIAPSGNWNGSGTANPETGVGGVDITSISSGPLFPIFFGTNLDAMTANFGATAFSGVAPTGFTASWGSTTSTTREPIISSFHYVTALHDKMYACNATKIYDVTTTTPVLVKSGQNSGNYAASQLANQGGDWLIVVNDAGDPPLRYNGTSWVTLAHTTPANWVNSTAYAIGARAKDSADNSIWKCAIAHTSPGAGTFAADRTASPTRWVADSASDDVSWITGTTGTPVEHGGALTYVCKYRNRLFFIERDSMNAWYLPLNAVGGTLSMIPLSGAATKGGKLMFCATWSIDAGDGIDDKLVFATDQGELLIFTGSNPSDAAAWRQEGRYTVSKPMGMNAHLSIGGDLIIATVDGIIPLAAAITKDRSELELAAITRNIKPMWREEVLDKSEWPWTMHKWDEYGGLFVTLPGGIVGKQRCLVANLATGAWTRFTGWDATCWMRLRSSMFFGTQTGQIMQADVGGYDNGVPYVATLVGGWEMFQAPSQTITWRMARASFISAAQERFMPQLSGTVDYVVTLPPAPSSGPDPVDAGSSLWDVGLWDAAVWDGGTATRAAVRNTGWVSIGVTGYSHAPIVQVKVGQLSKPEVELISIAGTFERLGVTV